MADFTYAGILVKDLGYRTPGAKTNRWSCSVKGKTLQAKTLKDIRDAIQWELHGRRFAIDAFTGGVEQQRTDIEKMKALLADAESRLQAWQAQEATSGQ